MTISIQERELMHAGIVRPLSQILTTPKEYTWVDKPNANTFGKGSVWFSDIGAVGYSDGVNWHVKDGAPVNKYVKNVYPGDSETIIILNANTTPAATTGVALVNPPANCRTGAQVGNTNRTQYNIPIPSGSNMWIFSFYAYQPHGVTGAEIKVHAQTGLVGTPNLTTQLTYNFDAPETSSTNIYHGTVSSTVNQYWCVKDVGNGWKRVSIGMESNPTHTLFVVAMEGAVSSAKTVYTGFQLEMRPLTDVELSLPSPYVSTKTIAPYQGQGRKGLEYVTYKPFPFYNVRCFSDSIWGSGSANFKLGTMLQVEFGSSSCHVMGGQTVDTICDAADAEIANLSNSLVIINAGVNDGPSLATNSSIINRIKQTVDSLGHTNYLVCGVLAKYKKSTNDGTEQTKTVNPTQYQAIIDFNRLASETFPNRFVDLLQASVNAYDPFSPSDVTAYNDGMRPPSLTGSNTDGLHPPVEEARVFAQAAYDFIIRNY